MTIIPTRALLTPALLLLLSSLPASRPGGPELGRSFKFKEYGYSIRVIKGWKSLPTPPDERFVVGSWKPDLEKAEKRGDYRTLNSAALSALTIVRIPLLAHTTGGTPLEQAQRKKKEKQRRETLAKLKQRFGKDMAKRYLPENMDDYIEGHWAGASKRYMKRLIKAKKVKGSLIEFTSGMSALCIGVFKRDAVEWGIIYQSNEETYQRDWVKVYKKSIKSIRFFKPKGDPNALHKAPKDLSKLTGDAKRAAIKEKIKGLPGWYALDTKNYVFLSNSKEKGFIRSLSRQIELVRSKVYEKLFPPQKAISAISIVRVLDSESEYYQYGGPRGSAGYWNSNLEELVLFTRFQGVTKKNSKAYCRSVMNHEAFHQYIHYAVGDLAPHPWFNEGHGDYFAGMKASGRSVRVGKFGWRTSYLKRYIAEKKSMIPIRSLVRLPQNEYYTNAGLKYSEGWALIYFLRKVTKNKRWREIPDLYFHYLVENIAAFKAKKKEKDDPLAGGGIPGIPGLKVVSFEDEEKVKKILSGAVDIAFKGVDFKALQKTFNRFVDGL